MSQISKRKLSQEYDELYNRASELFKKWDPCKINPKNGGCEQHRQYSKLTGYSNHTLCCSSCKHHSKKSGCQVKSLGCRLFICWYLEQRLPKEFLTELSELKKEARKKGFNSWNGGVYKGKKELINIAIEELTKPEVKLNA